VELRKLAYDFAKKANVEYPASWDKGEAASKDWYQAFMKRHEHLKLRTPEHTSVNRIKSFSKQNVQPFFDQLSELITAYEPTSIYNMDESGNLVYGYQSFNY